jgi:hypothetical protein
MFYWVILVGCLFVNAVPRGESFPLNMHQKQGVYGIHLRKASVVNLGCFGFSVTYFQFSDCFTSKRDELRLGQDLTECNERKVTMKKLPPRRKITEMVKP